jgi:glyoxylate carboligase
MANYYYSGQSCIDSISVAVLSSTTEYNIGDVVGATGPFGCFTITSLANSGDTVDFNIVTGYTDCISCIQSTDGVFIFSECSDPMSTVYIDVNEFNTVPSFLQSYYLELTGSTGCFVFEDWSPGDEPTDSISFILGPYEECNVCEGYNIPTSANTAYTLCTLDCDGNPIELQFPHPVWTDGYGNAVTQLNAVQLGGPNGLNN